MTNDFGTDFADEITDYFVDGADIPAAESTYFVTLYDDQGNELNGSLANGRVGVGTAAWSETDTNAFDNDNQIDFGENTSGGTITVQVFAIKDIDVAKTFHGMSWHDLYYANPDIPYLVGVAVIGLIAFLLVKIPLNNAGDPNEPAPPAAMM